MTASPCEKLHRDIIIKADIYGKSRSPRILAADYGFEGILGIPGLQTVDDIDKAYIAGAGVINDLIDVEDVPLRNITSGVSNIGLTASGCSDSQITETYMDALPIEFSHPVLPSSLDPKNFELKLNTGRTVTPLYATLNPNHEFNERQTVAIAGYFGNRKSSNSSNAGYPVKLNAIDNSIPLKLIKPDVLFEATGLSKKIRNPYNNYNGQVLSQPN